MSQLSTARTLFEDRWRLYENAACLRNSHRLVGIRRLSPGDNGLLACSCFEKYRIWHDASRALAPSFSLFRLAFRFGSSQSNSSRSDHSFIYDRRPLCVSFHFLLVPVYLRITQRSQMHRVRRISWNGKKGSVRRWLIKGTRDPL